MAETEAGEPTPQTCLTVARQAAELATAAADKAHAAVTRSRKQDTTHLEEIMHAAHREAVEAEAASDRAQQYADEGMPDRAVRYCARKAVEHAVEAQKAAGVEEAAAGLRAALERKLTEQERAERDSARRREEAQREAAEQAETGMDSDNRLLAAMNVYLAKDAVPELGWSTGHMRVMEAAQTGRLYRRDGQLRQAAAHGTWNGGRRVSRERTQDLHAAGFLTAVPAEGGADVLVPSPMGQVALELAQLHPEALHGSDKEAYEARYARVARQHKRSDDKKDAARRLPPLQYGAVSRYQRPMTLTEQQARAEREAAEQWQDEGGACPGVQPPCPAPAATPTTPAAPPAPAAVPVPDGPVLPNGMYFLPLPSTRYRDWWAVQCGRCQPGVRTELPGKWDDKYDAARAAQEHYDDAHRPVDDLLTEQEIAEADRWPLSDAQRTVLHWAKHAELCEYDDGFWALDCVPDRWDVNKKVARQRVIRMWQAGLLNVFSDLPGRRYLKPSPTGRRIARLLWRAERQGIAEPAAKDAKLPPLPERRSGYPLLSEGRYFKSETQPEPAKQAPAPEQPLPNSVAADQDAAPAPTTASAARADQPLLRRLFAPRDAREQRTVHDIRRVIRRPQRTLTPEERAAISSTAALNFQGGLIMGIIDPVPNPSPMPQETGAWVREHVWPEHFQTIERKYPHGFHRWSMCERGTCWNCLGGRCDLCVHRQKGGPDVDDNRDWVTNHQGRNVAQLILRPGGEPCVWWCRCSCPKDGPAPARPTAKPKPAQAPATTAPVPAAAPAAPLTGAPQKDAAQPALW